MNNAAGQYSIPESGMMPEFVTNGVDNAAMFDDITLPNFDIEVWVQQMNEMNGVI